MEKLVNVKTQTVPVSLVERLHNFERDVKIVTEIKEGRPHEALNIISLVNKENFHFQISDTFKYLVLKIECLLRMKRFDTVNVETKILIELSSKELKTVEIEMSKIALFSRENGEYIRAMLEYLCSLHCWLRDMRAEKVKKRTLEVINRGEKYALCLYYIGLQEDLRDIVFKFAIPQLQDVMEKYEVGPTSLAAHRDLSIMGCYFHVGGVCKRLGDPEKCIELTKEGANIGMRTLKEHKFYLLPKSHYQIAEAYYLRQDIENATRWYESALKLCPIIVNWDFQSTTERRKEFEKDVNDRLRYLKSLPASNS